MKIIHLLINAFLGGKKKAQKKKCKVKPIAKIFTTIEESQNNKVNAWGDNDDVIKGMEFCATMQLRTPLRVLLRHGEIHSNINTEPPKIAKEMWEGIWIHQIKTWSEMGINMDEIPDSTIASDIGQVKQEDYLPFLITVRKIVELNDSIENRIKMLREYPMIGDWRTCVESHDGINNIIEELFPQFIRTIPKISKAEVSGFKSLGLLTPNLIAAASDEAILSIKGIGQAKLKKLREYCAGISSCRDNERIESLTR